MENQQHRRSEDSELTELIERQPRIARPIVQCPGPGIADYLVTFSRSECGQDQDHDWFPDAGRDPRSYTVSCVPDPDDHELRNELIDEYHGSCYANEVCFQTTLGTVTMAFCIDVINFSQNQLLTAGQTQRSLGRTVPPEGNNVPQIEETVVHAVYSPSSQDAHIFEVALTGHDTQDSVVWVDHMSIQPIKSGQPIGNPTHCYDCPRNSVRGWPQDADAFKIDLWMKNPSDQVTVNWGRLFLPYI